MNRIRRLLGAVSASVLMLGGMVGMAGPAGAAHVQCGEVITASVTLDSDVGPCPDFGLHVAASGITVNLNGHRVFGANGPEETAGIHLMNVSGVTVTNGVVEGFDAGVAVDGGRGNTIENLVVRNNINDLSTTEEEPCIYGDGITTNGSDNNRIVSNQAFNNGPYSGISLVGDSDGNLVQGNLVQDNNVSNILPNGDEGPCGPFLASGPGPGRPHQDIGIRIEGPGANNNRVEANTVRHNQLNGITVHGHVCNPPPPPDGMPPRPPQDPNTNNTISANIVERNGTPDTGASPTEPTDGISLLRQGPLTVVCVAFNNTIEGNTSVLNGRHGVFLGAPTKNNTVNRNVVNSNTGDGIRVSGRPVQNGQPVIDPTTGQPFPGAVDNLLFQNQGAGNVEHDGHDDNPDCDNNRWKNNKFATVNQPCAADKGGKGSVGRGDGANDGWGVSNHPR